MGKQQKTPENGIDAIQTASKAGSEATPGHDNKPSALGKGVAQILDEQTDHQETVPMVTYQALLSENDGLNDKVIGLNNEIEAFRHDEGILKAAIEELENKLKSSTESFNELYDKKVNEIGELLELINSRPVIDFDTNTIVNTAELETIIQQNTDLKNDMGAVVGVLQGITGIFSDKLSPYQIPFAVGKIIANPGQMERIKGLTEIIEKYTPKTETHVG